MLLEFLGFLKIDNVVRQEISCPLNGKHPRRSPSRKIWRTHNWSRQNLTDRNEEWPTLRTDEMAEF